MTPTDRYSRQIRFAPLGQAGQRRLASSRVAVCGCGALGATSAQLLVRAGVGFVRVIDRDFLEQSNLHRQLLFDEADLALHLPKAVAAARKLHAINSDVVVESAVADMNSANIDTLLSDVDLIVDGLDNFETRFLINDFAIRSEKPWVFGGCVGATGQVATFGPKSLACLRCLIPEPPAPGTAESCDSAGVIGPIAALIASVQVAQAMQALLGDFSRIGRQMDWFDVWGLRQKTLSFAKLREKSVCPTCVGRRFDWLEGAQGSRATVLCGRDAVQISPGKSTPVRFDQLEQRLESNTVLVKNPYLIRYQVAAHIVTVFRDGRMIVTGATPEEARSLYSRLMG